MSKHILRVFPIFPLFILYNSYGINDETAKNYMIWFMIHDVNFSPNAENRKIAYIKWNKNCVFTLYSFYAQGATIK